MTKKTKGQKRTEKQKKRAKKTQDKLFKSMNRDTTVTRHKDGSRTIHLGEAASENIDAMIEKFTEFFGRPPEKDDPLVFDPDFPDKPTPMSEQKLTKGMVDTMRHAGMEEKYIYAFEQTGLIVSEMNAHLLTEDDKQEWSDAVISYEAMKQAEKEMP